MKNGLRLTIAAVAVAHCHSFAITPPARGITYHHVTRAAPTPILCRRAAIVTCDAAVPAPDEPTPLGKVKAWFSKWSKVDKAQLKALGVDAFFTYGVLSNANVGFLVSLSWITFSRASGLSPLAPGQWKGFVATYAGFYVSLGSILRPIRIALTVGAAPMYTMFVDRVRGFLPFQNSRPKLNRTLAIIIVSLLLNVIGTCGLIAIGVSIAGLVTGVPPVPPGWSFSAWRAS